MLGSYIGKPQGISIFKDQLRRVRAEEEDLHSYMLNKVPFRSRSHEQL